MIEKISRVYKFSFRKFGSNVYLLLKERLLIDTSSYANRKELISYLSKLVEPKDMKTILLTHSHYDHTGNIDLFKNAKIYSAKNISSFKSKNIKVIRTPGHTFDSICFFLQKEKILFSGDTLFKDGTGRTDLIDSAPEKMKESLKKLQKLRYKILCPGH